MRAALSPAVSTSDPGHAPLRAPLRAPPLRRRLAALVYEALLLAGIALAVTALAVLAQRLLPAPLPPHARDGVLQGALAVAFTLYGAGFWAGGRQTLPMKTWRLLLLDRQGRRVPFGRALWRAVLAWVWVLPPLAVAGALHARPGVVAALLAVWVLLWAGASRLRADRQFWHDALAGTRLVDAREHPDQVIGGESRR